MKPRSGSVRRWFRKQRNRFIVFAAKHPADRINTFVQVEQFRIISYIMLSASFRAGTRSGLTMEQNRRQDGSRQQEWRLHLIKPDRKAGFPCNTGMPTQKNIFCPAPRPPYQNEYCQPIAGCVRQPRLGRSVFTSIENKATPKQEPGRKSKQSAKNARSNLTGEPSSTETQPPKGVK